MGIPGFQKWLLRSFPEIVRVQGPKFGQIYDHVAFDMNQVIHQVSRRAVDRQALSSLMFRELDQILKSCVPRKSVFFAFDGPGPLAKLLTQRRRRNKAKKQHTAANSTSIYAKPTIDRLQFTPGVELLYYLRDAIEYWAYSRLQNDRKYRHVDIRISGADVAGEGELKLIDFCRAGCLPEQESIIVVGGDADIVLQGLATVPIRNFFVYLRNFSNSGRKKLNYVISVWELARTFEKLFPDESSGARADFILFSILNGNDYIPKIRGVTLGRLWRRYMFLKRRSPQGREAPFKGQCVVDAEKRTLNWPLFHALIKNVGFPVRTVEDEIQRRDSPSGADNPEPDPGNHKRGLTHISYDSSDDDAGDDIVYTGSEVGRPMFEVNTVWNSDRSGANTDSEGNDIALEDCNENDDIMDWEDEDDIDEEQNHVENLISIAGTSNNLYDTERWIRCLLWTLHMYIDGYCSDFMFQYGKPYGPSCDVLTKFITDHNGDPFVLHAPISNVPPLLPHQAAVAMLPRHAVHLLPKPLQRLVEDPEVWKLIFLERDVINIPAMLHAIDQVPKSEYTVEERQRTLPGTPFLLRRPRYGDRPPRSNPTVKGPGSKFPVIPRGPVIFRKEFTVTSSPPCYPWPQGTIHNMLNLPYLIVGGARLPRPSNIPSPDQTHAVKRSTVNEEMKPKGPENQGKSAATQLPSAKRGRRSYRGRQGSRATFKTNTEK